MRSVINWSDQLKDRDGNQLCVYDVKFSNDGEQIIAAAGIRIYVYNANDGTLLQSLKGHKENVLALAYSHDGKRFASGSADKTVIIWTNKLEGILKYTHGDAIRCLQYNPVFNQLASCTCSDFGLWSPKEKSVSKHKVASQINACSWTSDGCILGLALSSGFVSLRDRSGEEKIRIEKVGASIAPVWGVDFSQTKEDDSFVIATVDWTQCLTFYDNSGNQIGKERYIGFDPLNLSYVCGVDYILISGTNRKALLYTKEGISIGVVAEQSSWIWSCQTNHEGNKIVVGCQDGTVAVYDLTFSTVHSLYKERYAFRENMTEVIIQNLITDEKVRIKCRDLVKKLAIYKNRLAIQLTERIIIYELAKEVNASDMHYKVKEKINQKLDCTLLVVCAENIILCQEKILQCLTFKGTMEREWIMDSSIRYIRATGGPSKKEGLLVGLKNGQILQIFINNPFPINIIKLSDPIRCLDMSMLRQKVAVVDDKGFCSVYDIKSKQLLYQEPNANSVAWNSQFEEMLSYSGDGTLHIKAGNFASYQQPLQGFVVGFCGAKVFCLQYNAVTTIETSQSTSMYQYIEKKMFVEAYKTACLKVTDSDWEILAQNALENFVFDIARKSFIHNKNWFYLDLIDSYLHATSIQNKNTELSFLGDVMAYRGYYNDSAKLYRQSGNDNKAVTMYSDLRMFDQAQELLSTSDSQDKMQLTKRRADWIHNSKEPKVAAEMYLSAGDTIKAIEIIGQHGWVDMLMNVVRQLDKSDQDSLKLCAEHLIKHGQYYHAVEVYKKIGDIQNLAKMYIKSCQWQKAFNLANDYPHLKEDVYVPYALWLAENDHFVEAQQAFHKARKNHEALKVLLQLTSNAINENRFNDASYYCWILSIQCLDLAKDGNSIQEQSDYLEKYYDLTKKADIYYAYHNIHRYIEEPFTSLFPDALFNMARFLFHSVMDKTPQGISKVAVLYALAKQGCNMGAYKLTRHIYEKLHSLHIPTKFRDAIEINDLTIRGKPFSDAEDLLFLCYRCSTTNPLYNKKGNQCINCQQPFVFSCATFDVLPLVEFQLEDGISHEKAVQLLKKEPENESSLKRNNQQTAVPKWEEENFVNYQSLKLEDDYYDHHSDDGINSKLNNDAFSTNLIAYQQNNDQFNPVVADENTLLHLKFSDVIIIDWPEPLRKQYFRNFMPDILMTKCQFCNKLFHCDEYEMQVLQLGHCPFCRNSNQQQN